MKVSTSFLAVFLSAVMLCCVHSSFAQSTTYPPGAYTVTVPAGVTTMQVTATGAAGGSWVSAGGRGASAMATYAVTPGTVYYIYVGSKAGNTSGSQGLSSGGGEDGGRGGTSGSSTGIGGGAGSDVRSSITGGATSAASLNSRLVVGGGGGGAAGSGCTGNVAGANGGYPAGANGPLGACTSCTSTPAGGGTQTAGGAKGGTGSCASNQAGTFGAGGTGGTTSPGGTGGGGGGWYGGGGAYSGGGGGGSSYATTTGIIGTATFTNGVNTGDGEVIICFSAGAITGPSTVCPGGTISLTDVTPGGTWSSSNPAAATVDAIGTVYGVAGGSTIISYAAGPCPAVMTVTVSSLGAITGTTAVCAGSTTTLSSTTTGGVWTSDNLTVATISGSVTVHGAAAGTANISYTVGSCAVGVAVNVSAGLAPMAGTFSVCQGATTQLSSSPSGGAWTSSNGTIATVDAAGLVTGVSGGTVNISYTSGGCAVGAAVTVTAIAPITGATLVCAGSTLMLSNAAAGGVWSSDNLVVATVAGPMVTGVAAGTANISYTNGSCASGITITVSGAIAPITGPPSICVGTTTTFSSSPGGGVWSSSNPAAATIDASGNATAVATGSTNISYTAGGCATGVSVSVINMTAILGPTTVCPGGTITLSNASTGGVWSSDNTAAATVSATGVVSGAGTGTANISYVIGSCSAVSAIIVNTLPVITGSTTVCPGSTTPLSNTTAGGVWSSTSPGVATVDAGGVVYGVMAGTTNISYTVGTCAVGTPVTVTALPAITGTTTLCSGSTVTLSNASAGGVWSSTNSSIATIDPSSGVVTGVATGGATISYTLGTCAVGTPITVSGALGPISGATTLCAGATTPLSNATSGGVWSSTNIAVATVSGTGILSGASAGTTTISYTAGGCSVGLAVTINALPAIVGPTNVCAGATIQLSNAVPGGAWTSGLVSVATITSTGIVTGVASGTSTIAYSVSGCSVSVLITVGSAVAAISGPATVCAGATIALSDATPGGVWASDNASAATISATGVVSGVAAGNTNISYSVGACDAVLAVTVVASSAGIIDGVDSLCKGAGHEVNLSSSVGGGVWSSSNTNRATVDPATGVVTGVNTGVFTITYTVTNSCGTFTVTNAMYVRTPAKCATSVSITGSTASGLNIAPNPNNGIFTAQLSADASEDVHIVVTNILGQVVMQLETTTNTPTEIKLEYAPGIYLISAATAHERYVTKMVVR